MCCELPDVRGRHVVLGVTGGIAVYKSCEIVSRLRKLGVETHVIMTKNAAQFVQPLTFETLSNHPVVTDTFARPETWEVEHIALAKRADVFAIAPATANIMAKMACGIADDMLSTTVLATKAPISFASRSSAESLPCGVWFLLMVFSVFSALMLFSTIMAADAVPAQMMLHKSRKMVLHRAIRFMLLPPC